MSVARFTHGQWNFEGKTVAGSDRVGGSSDRVGGSSDRVGGTSDRVGGFSGCDVVGGLARREKLSLVGMEHRFVWSSSTYLLRLQLYRSPFDIT